MEKDEQKDYWTDQTVHWTQGVHHVAQETSAYELWIKLEEMYQVKIS